MADLKTTNFIIMIIDIINYNYKWDNYDNHGH